MPATVCPQSYSAPDVCATDTTYAADAPNDATGAARAASGYSWAPDSAKRAQLVPADATNQAFSALSDSAYDAAADCSLQAGSASQSALVTELETASATGSRLRSRMHAASDAALSTDVVGNLIEMPDET